MKVFDTLHLREAEYTEKVKSKCKDILFQFYFVTANKIEDTSTIRYNKIVMIKNFEEIAQRAWGQTAGGIKNVKFRANMNVILRQP